MDKAYDTFHEVLVKLFNEIMDIEAKAIITPEFKDIFLAWMMRGINSSFLQIR